MSGGAVDYLSNISVYFKSSRLLKIYLYSAYEKLLVSTCGKSSSCSGLSM